MTRANRNTGAWLTLAVALLTLIMRLTAGPWPVDDAYITFRYARTLADGLGLVYNPGQSVLGTSTPAFTILLAAIHAVTGLDFPWVALAVGAVADAATVLLMHHLAIQLGLPGWSAVMCSLIWALYPLAARYTLGGMETSLACVLTLSAFTLHLGGRQLWATVVVGLAVLTRPDALAGAFVILAAEAVQRRRSPWRSILIFAATLLPWVAFATWQYGNPVPQSLQAKSRAVYLTSPEENVLQVLYQVAGLILAAPTSLAAKGINVSLPPGERLKPVMVAAVLLTIWVIGALHTIRQERRWAAFFAFPVLVTGTYALLGLRGNLIAEWYLVPVAPFFFLGLLVGLVSLCRRLPPPFYPSMAIGIALFFTVVQLTGLSLQRFPGRHVLVPRSVWTEREDLYRKAADLLRPRLQRGDVVAASEIGALGYFCRCEILDTVGLVSPEVLRYYPLPRDMYAVNYAVPPDLIRNARPAYLVTLDVFIRRSLLPEAWFQRDYELLAQVPTDAFGSSALLVFSRIPVGKRPGNR